MVNVSRDIDPMTVTRILASEQPFDLIVKILNAVHDCVLDVLDVEMAILLLSRIDDLRRKVDRIQANPRTYRSAAYEAAAIEQGLP